MSSPGGAVMAQSDDDADLTDGRLRQGVELMFFAYRDMVTDADRLLEEYGYGRAHHRAMHFIRRRPGLSVAELLEVLAVTKQSLNRVLRQLVEDGMVVSAVGEADRRQRLLTLSAEADALVAKLSQAQHRRMRRAFEAAGPDAVRGFQRVLRAMMDADSRGVADSLIDGDGI